MLTPPGYRYDPTYAIVDYVVRSDIATATSASINLDLYTVPPEYFFLLNLAMGRTLPGAAQYMEQFALSFVDGPVIGGTVRTYASANSDDSSVVNIWSNLNWTGELLLPPGSTLRASGVWNAGVASNRIDGTIAGFLLPRGNIARA